MENKEDIIKSTIRKFTKVATKFNRSEELPIRVDDTTTISTREAHVIQAVGDNRDIGITELASRFGVSKSAASQMVSKLSKNGFLIKRRSETSNKEIKLELTDLGRLGYRAHERYHNNDLESIVGKFKTFSLSQIATLSVMLEAFDEIMEERIRENLKK